MNTLEGLLAGIVAEPKEETRWLVLADWLEENDDPRRGELLRLHRNLLATCCEPEKHRKRAKWQARIVELIGEGVRPCVPQETLSLAGNVEMRFSFIPPGSFLMGSKNGSDHMRPIHTVELTKGFYLGIFPVTQAHWKVVMGTDPSHFKGVERPVEQVSWIDAVEFCTELTVKLSGAGQIRLPTEAEWEYACRAGTTTDFHTGNGEDALRTAGWYYANSGKETQPVGQLAMNAWNLHDMHGNVYEWCNDWSESYSSDKLVDPVGPDSGLYRVRRGGSWYGSARDRSQRHCWSGQRNSYAPMGRNNILGFRVALVLKS